MKPLALLPLLLLSIGCTADTFTGPDSDVSDAAPDLRRTFPIEAGPLELDASPEAAPDAIASDADAHGDAPAYAPDACGGVGDMGTCSHSLCSVGAALVSGCDPEGLVANICPFHPECCNSAWSQGCVDLAMGQQAFACTGC